MSQDTRSSTQTAPFLLEIGSEEIPARFIPSAMKDLERLVKEGLSGAHLTWQDMKVLATPRRMALLIDGLSLRQPDREVEIKGPPVSVAFGQDGAPTKAAEGFARKAGVNLEDCERGQDQRGEYLVARKLEEGRPAAEVLAEVIPPAVLGVPFRKVMRWGDRDLEYPRPLQWIVALLGEDIVPLKVDYLAAGRISRGHRTLANDREVAIDYPDAYLGSMREAGVVVDHQERRETISQGFQEILAAYDEQAVLLQDEELLDEVVFLCEHPTPFLGAYNEDFVALPPEVITTALKAHQRYFTVRRREGEGLLPRFAAVRDGGTDFLANVVAGNERVLRARLADALFYWDFDQKKTPDERVDMLETVTWLEGFGSVQEKTGRIGKLAAWLWANGLGDGGEAPADLLRAAHLCKSDLVSEMIKDGKEFTKLEGFIGARYAGLAGEPERVCRAIENHYLPRSAGGALPGDPISAVLSVADRLDNLAGCWLAGFIPTGAKDPYALRRHVLAVLRILLDRQIRLDLAAAIDLALQQVAGFAPGKDLEEARAGIEDFVRTRIAGHFTENMEADPEVVRAVLPARWTDPVDALAWVRALSRYRDQTDFQLLATGFKRCRNILEGDTLPVSELAACLDRWKAGGQGSQGQDFAGLTEAAERQLLEMVAGQVENLHDAENSGDYPHVFGILSDLGPAIDRFFDEVRVNAEDEKIRSLRHAFLREIHGLFSRYADFSAVAPADK
jgi:glycyl-tRNA synthetase beta chain